MKTKQELFDQFQSELDRKRKSDVVIALIIAHIVTFAMFGYPLLVLLPNPLLIRVAIAVAMELLILITSFTVAIDDAREFNVNS